MEKLTLIKVGGKIVEEPDTLQALLRDFAAIEGRKLLVHGGGRSATKLAEQLGIPSRMVNGRRITDADTLRVVTMVYGGLVNKNIVAGLQALGVDALGMTGADLNILRSDKRPVKDVDYGYVGDVKEARGDMLARLIADGVVPVLAPLTHDGQGHILNTNADTVAQTIAVGMSQAYETELVFCFEKRGVLMNVDDDNSVIPEITPERFAELKAAGVVADGMLPKLENAFRAIDNGVKSVVICSAEAVTEPGYGGTKLFRNFEK